MIPRLIFTVIVVVAAGSPGTAKEFAGPHTYRAGDAIISYQIPRDLVSAYSRVERVFRVPDDPLIFRTAYRSQGILVETAYGNFTMGVIPTPEALRPSRSVRALNDYYSLVLSSGDTFAETASKRSGDREWLHVICRPREKPEKISSILHYTEISPDFILYIGLGSGTSEPFHARLLKKLTPLVDEVVASVRISRVAEPAKTNGSR
jgi:hypothetical protein